MCVYCFCGDWVFKWPPRDPYPWHPLIPQPINPNPFLPWPIEKLKEFEELLRRIKDLEDKVGCECEPNKADYIDLIKLRIEQLEAKVNK